tara:strand:- start:3 stop:437 length:435 start_codon:yes stop_codon:yes gene_type:complete
MIKNIILFKSKTENAQNTMFIDFETGVDKIEEIKKHNLNEINIYDQTYNKHHKNGEIITVRDHINKTGDNPLIGNQDKFTSQFIDISALYESQGGVVTTCLGKSYNQEKNHHHYPSTHICHISIIAKALGIKKIKGFLVNRINQ